MRKRKHLVVSLLIFTFFFCSVLAVVTGLFLVTSWNWKFIENEITPIRSALPTLVFDRHNQLITEFFSEEKREVISLEEVPEYLVFAILTREDRRFFEHSGFDITRLFKAVLDIVSGDYSGGASTITQQVAGNRFLNRQELTLRRKILELWYALQVEKQYTKQEILEFYINEVPFGGGTNGVEAAAQFYFQKSAREISLAESVLLANVIANHFIYSPIKSPNISKKRQLEILGQMVELGYVSQEEADLSFYQYWQGYKGNRFPSESAWMNRDDKAPWFSWYLQDELADLRLNSDDILKGGLRVYTTLDLEYQAAADNMMSQGLSYANKAYERNNQIRSMAGDKLYTPVINLLALGFNLKDLRTASSKERNLLKKYFRENINPLIDVLGLTLNRQDLMDAAARSFVVEEQISHTNKVEGALVSIDSHTGHILAMIGGSRLDSKNNWFNRAVDGNIQPGSLFKPLYYAAAINTKKFDAASVFIDRPLAFENGENTYYIPQNYKGLWHGQVLLREALAESMNVPSLKLLHSIGYDTAIDQSAALLGITDPFVIENSFPRIMPLGLGIIQVAPLQIARAYASFPNGGKEVVPVAIRYIEDRYGKVILEPEKQILNAQKRKASAAQLLSPQAAYIMCSILEGTIKQGTLAGSEYWTGGWDDRPVAGKTGTTQNWSAAWTCGFTNQVTTALWFGFDQGNRSLGNDLTGASLAGRFWATYMKEIHEDLPKEKFSEPAAGIGRVTVCSLSGDLPSPEGYCDGHIYEELFIEGTQPREYCAIHKLEHENSELAKQKLENRILSLWLDQDNPFKLTEPNPKEGYFLKEQESNFYQSN